MTYVAVDCAIVAKVAVVMETAAAAVTASAVGLAAVFSVTRPRNRSADRRLLFGLAHSC